MVRDLMVPVLTGAEDAIGKILLGNMNRKVRTGRGGRRGRGEGQEGEEGEEGDITKPMNAVRQ